MSSHVRTAAALADLADAAAPRACREVLEAAVSAEDADALYLAAELWRDGVGGPRDPRRALHLCELAQLRGRSAHVEIGVLRRELRAEG